MEILIDLPVPMRARTSVDDITGCWLYRTSRADGYAQYSGRYVHVMAWEAAHPHEKIPSGHEIDHLCFVRNCYNPAHLECITLQENRRRRRPRASTPAEERRPQGQCKNGHDWIGNAKLNTQHQWVCIGCAREAARRYGAKRDPRRT